MVISIVSPHRDDAAFSLGLAIRTWLAAGHTIDVVNCFTRSDYAPFSDVASLHVNDRTTYVSALRLREDQAWQRSLRAGAKKLRLTDLNLKDAPRRLRISANDVCGLPVAAEDKALLKIRKSLQTLKFDALLIPLALGGHVDHKTARDAAMGCIPAGVPCAFYEDLPYATRPNAAEEIADDVASLGLALTAGFIGPPQDPAAAVADKRAMAQCYDSQIDSEVTGQIAGFCERYQGRERMWGNVAWQASALALRNEPQREPQEELQGTPLHNEHFRPGRPLIPGSAHPACRAVVVIPARNEEAHLDDALDAFAAQTDPAGNSLPQHFFEILLLLNNCTDRSADVAHAWRLAHPQITLHVLEVGLKPRQAHVGTARRMLMDTAWHRLHDRDGIVGMLSTDADTTVAQDWIARSLCALEQGADAVGGFIDLKPGELNTLPAGARRAYLRERRYKRLIAELEDLLDPQPGDPWPRHLEHFGASLACTPQIYAAAGGLPAVKPLEDVAFVNALRSIEARLRHDPSVIVYTSSRMEGRAEVGLSGQLSIWQQMAEDGEEHRVRCARWLTHRFRTLGTMRKACAAGIFHECSEAWKHDLAAAHAMGLRTADCLAHVDCERILAEAYQGDLDGEITRVSRNLAAAIARVKNAVSDQAAGAGQAAGAARRSSTSMR